METLQTIAKRFTARSYEQKQIEEKDLQTILKAGLAAPIGCNAKDCISITVIQNSDLMRLLNHYANQALERKGTDFFYGAPTLIVISAKVPSPFDCEVHNAACIAENMTLAATDLGLGSAFLTGFLEAFKVDDNIKGEVGIPESFEPFAGVIVGYSTESGHQNTALIGSENIKYIR